MSDSVARYAVEDPVGSTDSRGDRRLGRLTAADSGRRVTTLQWAVGFFCAFNGALMAVAPHQFSGPIWGALQGQLSWVGFLFILAGMALLGSGILGLGRRWVVASHLVAALALLTIAWNLALVGAWPGVAFQAVFVLGAAVAPFVTGLEGPGRAESGDFFALVYGGVNAAYGLAMLLLPGQLLAPVYDPVRPYLALYGAAFLATSAALILAQLYAGLPGWLYRAAHLSILVPAIPYVLAVPLPSATWTGIVIYCVLAPLVASLPWTGARLRSIDPRAFSVRLAFLLVLTAALPLIAVMGAVTAGQEQQARSDAEKGLQASASAIASDVTHYLSVYTTATAALATYPGLTDLPVAAQRETLRRFARSYPDANVFSTYDAAGRGIARSDDIQPIADISKLEIFQKPKLTLTPAVVVQISSTLHVPIFAIGAPIRGADGAFAGQVGSSVRSDVVAAVLNRASRISGTRVYLVDSAGRAIAHPDASLVASLADLSGTPQVAAALASPADNGVVSSSGPNGELLAAYARASDLGWTVVVDESAASALAAVRSARNTAFGLLLVAIALAVVGGSLLARQMAAPLTALSTAAGRLARGDSAAPLPSGSTSEVAGLVESFADMRDKLAARTAEREELLHTVQAQNEELASQYEELQSQNEELQSHNEEMQTQSKELERLLGEVRQGEERLRTMADAIPQLAWMANPDGYIYWYNRRWYEYTGTTPEEMEGWGWQSVHDPEMLPAVLERWQASIAMGEAFEMDFPLKGADGRFGWFLTRVYPLKDPEGRVLHWFGTNTDITHHKEAEAERERLLEAEREAREQAEAATRLRDEFLSVAAHELKTPVTSLKGYAQVMLRKHRDGTLRDEQLAAALAQMDKQSTRMARLAEELLEVSRFDAGRVAISPQAAEVVSVVEAALATMREVHPGRDFHLAAPGPVHALLDAGRIEQVLINLLDNAVKFSPADRPVEIQVGQDGAEGVEITVRDYGRGVPEGERTRVFERFHQAHPAEHYGGMGLGLFISAEIVRMHGGTITCEDPGGEGALFVVRLPGEGETGERGDGGTNTD